mgnify:CR=1 FL=1
MNFAAIDPGVKGGVATYIDGKIDAWTMPSSPVELADRLCALNLSGVYVEDVPKFTGVKIPGSMVAVLFQSVGVTLGVCAALKLPVIMVRPKDWQKACGVGGRDGLTHSKWKQKLRDIAKARFPDIKVTLETADALLIASTYIYTNANQNNKQIRGLN